MALKHTSIKNKPSVVGWLDGSLFSDYFVENVHPSGKKHASFKYAINAIFMPIHPLLAQVKGAPAETICKNKN